MGNQIFKVVYSEKAKPCKLVDIFLKGTEELRKEEKYKKIVIEIHYENEFGEDLPNSILYTLVEKEFDKIKVEQDFDYCWITRLNEYVIITEIKE